MSEPIPPLEPLLEVAKSLREAGVSFALGGSGLLHALGLVNRVGDWDLTTDSEPNMIYRMFEGWEHERAGSSGIHADQKLRFFSGSVELIVRMALRAPSGICRIPTMPRGTWRGIPLGSAEAWAAAYALMDRAAKAELLFAHLERVGADRVALGRMLREPLPGELSARLRALPLSGPG